VGATALVSPVTVEAEYGIHDNALLPVRSPLVLVEGFNSPEIAPQEVLKPEPTIVTLASVSAYSSEESQTDDTPFITASGERVRRGIVANNCLEFGTEVEIDGTMYEVQDRMNARYECEYFDIWMDDGAMEYGRQELEVKIYGEWIDHRVFSSCVLTARWLGLDLPRGDAVDLVPNSAPVVGGGLIIKYQEDTAHVAVIKGFDIHGYMVAEGNYKYNEITHRTIPYDDERIIGFYRPK